MRIVNPGSAGETDPASLPYAFIYKSGDSAENTNPTVNVPLKVVATTTSKRLRDFTTDSAGAVTYTGTASFYARVEGKVSGGNGTDQTNNRFELTIAKNGTAQEAGKHEKTSNSIIDNACPTTSDLLIENGDYISIFVENKTAGGDAFYNTSYDLLVTFERWA